MPIGPVELILILFIVLLLFGATRVPELGRSLGRGMREFKQGVTGKGADEDDQPRAREERAGESRLALGADTTGRDNVEADSRTGESQKSRPVSPSGR